VEKPTEEIYLGIFSRQEILNESLAIAELDFDQHLLVMNVAYFISFGFSIKGLYFKSLFFTMTIYLP